MSKIKTYRYLTARRIVQAGLLVLFAGANYAGWNILKGNYSSAILADTVPFSDPWAVLQILFSGFVAGSDLLIGAAIVLLLYGLFLGRAFCSWICPFNIVSDTALWLSKKMNIKHSASLPPNTRYGVLLLGVILTVILGVPAFEVVSPVSMLHRAIIFGAGTAWAVIAAIFLFDIAVVKNGWCGHLCPLGAFYSFTGKYSLLKVRHTSEKCTNCNKCFDVCHEPQVLDIIGQRSGIIRHGECSNCGRCIEACEDDALHFSIRKRTLKQ
jgi:ferredoxin-type protein NapH